MTPRLAHARRGKRAFERLYLQHVGDVYRYALVLLRDPHAAEEVTRTAFVSAYRAHERGERSSSPHVCLLELAHAACRLRVSAADLADDAALPAACEVDVSCDEAGLAVSRQVDGLLSWRQRRVLRGHLRHCGECSGFARSQRAQRSAWAALAAIPVPASLESFVGTVPASLGELHG